MTEKVNAVVNEQILPALQQHGGGIEVVEVDEASGRVSVRLQGACQGCPGAQMTMRMGVERHLKQHVPGVQEVVAVS
ncbi:MAG: NifU family protein [Phycisphaerae bacterium]|nr:NifU family protein [Phycisphaerae bacterium]